MPDSARHLDLLDLEIRIFPRLETEGYPVYVRLGDQQDFPSGVLAADVLPWSTSTDPGADGQRLFETLFASPHLQRAWDVARGKSRLRRIRLWIDTNAPELHTIPWELLRDNDVLLAASADTPFSRYLSMSEAWGGPVTERPLRVLGVISNPGDLDRHSLMPLDVDRENILLTAALGQFPPEQIRLDFLDAPVTLERLEQSLQQGYHIVHFVGHGSFNQRRGQSVLYLQNESGNTRLVLDNSIGAMFARQQHRPHLMVLAACQSAVRASGNAFRGMGPSLVAAGIPAVVAMQDRIAVQSARTFTTMFYTGLVKHGIVDLALNQARSAMLSAERPDAAAPVLFMRLVNGQLFAPAEAQASPRDVPPPISSPPPLLALHQLPPDIADFVGRVKEKRCILKVFESSPNAKSTTLPICTLVGMPGVGKSTLAVHAAHRLQMNYTDAQLYVNLRGTAEQPLTSVEALSGFLRALGVEDHALPKAQGELARLYRAMLSGKRVLVLLDDAQDEAQVRPLLPGSPTCGVLITSRRSLNALDGTEEVVLETMTEKESLSLLRKLVGSKRVAAELDVAKNLVALCGYLPLAVRIAGGKLKSRRHWALAHYTARLADEHERLKQLHLGDLDVRAGFDLSYGDLKPDAQRLFRLLGMLEGGDFCPELAAALLDADLHHAWDVLEHLVDVQLVESVLGDRYRFNSLVQLFAQEQLEKEPGTAQKAARLRVARWHGAASAAQDAHLSSEARRQQAQVLVHRDQRSMSEHEQVMLSALAWFEAERINLLLSVTWADAAEAWDLSWHLVKNLFNFFSIRSYWGDWERSHQLALRAARKLNDAQREGFVLNNLGIVYRLVGRWDEALNVLQEGLRIGQELHDRDIEGQARAELGLVYQLRGRRSEAVLMLEESLRIYQGLGDRHNENMVRNLLGNTYRILGRWDEALDMFEKGLRINQELNNPYGESITLNLMGTTYRLQGHWDEACERFEQSLSINRRLGNQYGIGIALGNLGNVYRLQNRWDEALDLFEQSLQIADELGDPRGKNITLNYLGTIYRLKGDWDAGLAKYEECLFINRALGDLMGQSISLGGLGNIYRLQGRWDKAIVAYEESLCLAQRLDDRRGRSITLNNLGYVYCRQGACDKAETALEESLHICRDMGNRRGECIALRLLGEVRARQARWAEAVPLLEQSLDMARALEDARGVGQALTYLGDIYGHQERWDEATQCFDEALDILRETGDRHGQGLVMRNQGLLYKRHGQETEAVAAWQEGLTMLHPDSPEYKEVSAWLG